MYIKISKIFFLSFLLLLLNSCESVKQRNARIIKQECSPGNYIDWVRAGENACLAMDIWGAKALKKGVKTPKTLLIYLSGDHSLQYNSALPYSRQQRQQAGIINNETLTVLLSRPGYSIRSNTSTGNAHNGDAYYSQQNVDILASAIGNLKQHYQPEKVLLVGNSSGASMALIMMSQYHDIVDVAVIASCACAFFEWGGNNSRTFDSLDPIDFVDKLPKESEIYLFVGSNDTNTSVRFTQKFFDKTTKRGLKNIKMTVIKGANHAQTKTSQPVLEKIKHIISL